MRVLLAPDGFTGTLTAREAAEAVALGWRRSRPGDDLDLCPMSDGGPDFVEVLHAALGGALHEVVATGPLGDPVTARVLLAGRTAFVESALVCGSALVPPSRRDPVAASTAGVGQLLEAALATGAEQVLVGLGGSCTTDGGAGALAALGAGADLHRLPQVQQRWQGVDLVLASDVDVPLLGPRGAARGFAPQKGATPAQVEVLEARLTAWADRAAQVLGRDLREVPAAGAAGGLGFGLLLLGARTGGGARAVADAVGLTERAARADVVVTGEGSLDWQSLRGKVVAEVIARSRAAGTPVVAVAGQVGLSAAEVDGAGLAAAVAVAAAPGQVAGALADPRGTLAAKVAEVARAW